MKKIASIFLVIAMLLSMAACGGSGNNAPAQDTGEFISGDGWSVNYEPKQFAGSEIKGGGKFTYLGETAGESYLAITFEDGKMPNEVLGEHTNDWDESQYRAEGFFPGTEDKWCYTRMLNKTEDKTEVSQQFTAAEFGSGTLLIEALSQTDGSDEQGMAVSDAMAELINSIKYDFFPMQTELAYVEGTYIQKVTEELEGEEYEFTYYVTLNEDHTGKMSIQDDIDLYWGSNTLWYADGTDSYEYTVEGDNLYVNFFDEDWEEFKRTIPPYYYIGSDDTEAVVYNYLSQNVGNELEPGQICIPVARIIKVDDSDKNDIKVYGDFWVFDYELEGDTLMCVSGGAWPGLIHLKAGELRDEVTGMDVVEDGSSYDESAKKIFGDLYDEFIKTSSDDTTREQLRKEVITDYVHANYLDNIKYYKDYGWDAVKID